MRGALGLLGLVVFGVFLGLLVLATVELGLRLGGIGEGPPGYDPFAGFSAAVPLLEPALRGDGTPIYRVSPLRLNRSTRTPVFHPEREFLAEKPSGSFRIFVVGGSSAAGFPYRPYYAFSGWLSRRLQAMLPDLPVEVVNLAIAGYSTRRVLLVAREIAAHEPDLLIVYSGHNEWAEQRYYSHLIGVHPLFFQMRERFFTTRLFTLLSRLVPASRESAEEARERFARDEQQEFEEMFAVFSRRAEGSDYATPDQIVQRDRLFRLNLEEIARAGRMAGARVMLLSLSQNFADWAPGASTHAADRSQAQLSRWEGEVAAGDSSAATGDCAGALESYARALAIDDRYAELHYKVAGCHRRLGSLDAARKHYQLASDLDRVPHGAPTYFNDVIREIAGARDLLFVDAAEELRRESDDGLVGDDLFIEFAHPNLRAHQRIARAIAETLRRADVPAPADRWRRGAYADPTPEALYGADPQLRAQEHTAIRFACTLARRPACVREHSEALLELQSQEVPPERTPSPVGQLRSELR